MTTPEYGEQAPKLEDGSLLLQERVLTPEQVKALISDHNVLISEEKASKKRHLFINALSFIVSFGLFLNAFLIFATDISSDVFVVVALVGVALTFVLTSRRSKERNRFAACIAKTINQSSIARIIGEMTERYDSVQASKTVVFLQLLGKKTGEPVNIGGKHSLRIVYKNDQPVAIQEIIPPTA